MADLFFFLVLIAVIVYAVGLAKKKAAARQQAAFDRAFQHAGTASVVGGPVTQAGPVTVRNGGVTVTVQSSSSTMADGTPLTPYAANALQHLTHDPQQMAAIREALEANGMGSMASMVEQQLGHVFETTPNAEPAANPSAAVFSHNGGATPGPSATNEFTSPQAAAPGAASTDAAAANMSASASPFEAPVFDENRSPFSNSVDPFASAPVFPNRHGSSARDSDDERDGPFSVRPPKG